MLPLKLEHEVIVEVKLEIFLAAVVLGILTREILDLVSSFFRTTNFSTSKHARTVAKAKEKRIKITRPVQTLLAYDRDGERIKYVPPACPDQRKPCCEDQEMKPDSWKYTYGEPQHYIVYDYGVVVADEASRPKILRPPFVRKPSLLSRIARIIKLPCTKRKASPITMDGAVQTDPEIHQLQKYHQRKFLEGVSKYDAEVNRRSCLVKSTKQPHPVTKPTLPSLGSSKSPPQELVSILNKLKVIAIEAAHRQDRATVKKAAIALTKLAANH